MMNLKYGMKRLGVRDDQQLVSIERDGGGGGGGIKKRKKKKFFKKF